MTSLASAWTERLLLASIEAGVLCALLYLLLFPMRSRLPVARVWLWRAALLKFPLALCGFGIPLTILEASGSGSRPSTQADPLTIVIALAGVVGAVLAAYRLLEEATRIRKIRSDAVPIDDERLRRMTSSLCSVMGISRPPALMSSRSIHCPILVGAFRPAVIFPEHISSELPVKDAEAVLAHELAHLAHRDLIWGWLPGIVNLFFFFHPLAHLARRELYIAQESACDSRALNVTGSDRGTYARTVFDMTGHLTAAHDPAVVVGLSDSADLIERRFRAIENKGEPFRARSAIGGALGCLALVSLLPHSLKFRNAPALRSAPNFHPVSPLARVSAPGRIQTPHSGRIFSPAALAERLITKEQNR